MPELKDVGASVRQRLLNLAHARGEDFQYVLTHYAIERLVVRIVEAGFEDRFVLKGAALFSIWSEDPYRATKDLDLLGSGDPSVAAMIETFQAAARADGGADGITFDPGSVNATEIRSEARYPGIRIGVRGSLSGAEVGVQVDVGFGDVVRPAVEQVVYPAMLDMPTPGVRCYPPESVIAEKYEAMIRLSVANSRLKDYFDVWALSERFAFTAGGLVDAVTATFERRGTPVPTTRPIALAAEFAGDVGKMAMWNAFLGRGRVAMTAPSLAETADQLAAFLGPTWARGSGYREWHPGGPWGDD